jgi:hypothetical protein
MSDYGPPRTHKRAFCDLTSWGCPHASNWRAPPSAPTASVSVAMRSSWVRLPDAQARGPAAALRCPIWSQHEHFTACVACVLILPPARSQDTAPHPRARGSLTTKHAQKWPLVPPSPCLATPTSICEASRWNGEKRSCWRCAERTGRSPPSEWWQASSRAAARAPAGAATTPSSNMSCQNRWGVVRGRCDSVCLAQTNKGVGLQPCHPPSSGQQRRGARQPVRQRLSTATHSSRSRGSRSQRRQASRGARWLMPLGGMAHRHWQISTPSTMQHRQVTNGSGSYSLPLQRSPPSSPLTQLPRPRASCLPPNAGRRSHPGSQWCHH